ncbi:hypothetical protein OSB04_001183 [Centaurea solstitialis]|uniref:holo-[acyl-carrier-protein] synthase n=1 Tax=Centaurea solstitialis TaxID=347529 RepID=A0AA38WL77_9ASTR|nr:hypothetical protein OSB04_001183 [Centaurea solstitialis]
MGNLRRKEKDDEKQILSFARRYFSREEVERLSAISDPEVQRQEVIKLWTLKEAYVKALGTGFSGAPFNTFTIRFESANPNPNAKDPALVIVPLESPTNLTTNWRFAQVELAGTHYAAICRENAGISKVMTRISRREPMKLIVRKTVPLVEEHCDSEIDLIV